MTSAVVIKALIFDLDNCLAPAAQIGEGLFEPAFSLLLTQTRHCLSAAQQDAMMRDIWRHPLDWVAEKYQLEPALYESVRRIFSSLRVATPMSGYDDLHYLGRFTEQCFLVTSGFEKLQRSKIEALGFAGEFNGVFIDAIDTSPRLGKQGIFAHIMQQHGWQPAELLVIGDSEASELKAGKALGITTVQTLRPDVPRAEMADFHITSITELPAIIKQLASGPFAEP